MNKHLMRIARGIVLLASLVGCGGSQINAEDRGKADPKKPAAEAIEPIAIGPGEVIELSAPAGVAVEIHDVAGGAERVKEAAAADEAAFVLMRSPVTALRLREMGVPFDVLNIGGIGAGPDRKPLYRNISASQDELEALRRLEQMGTRVELRIVANDKAVPFTSVDRG